MRAILTISSTNILGIEALRGDARSDP